MELSSLKTSSQVLLSQTENEEMQHKQNMCERGSLWVFHLDLLQTIESICSENDIFFQPKERKV